jgi:hypothetical protein
MLACSRLSVAFSCAVSILLFACTEDVSEKYRFFLPGRWELYKGFRNKKPTETLTGVYFEFTEQGTMKTNLPLGPEEPVPFELSKNQIQQKGSKPLKYEIRQICDTTMLLSLETRGMPFEFYLRKATRKAADTTSNLTPVRPAPDSVK